MPTGVVIGPLIATPLRRMLSTTRSGRGVPSRGDGRLAGLLDLPGEPDAGRLEDTDSGLAELGANPIAGDQSDGVGHGTWSPVRAGHSAGGRDGKCRLMGDHPFCPRRAM